MTKDHHGAKAHLDNLLDDALRRTFPASDPVAISSHQESEAFRDNTAARRFELRLTDGTVIVEYEPGAGGITITHTEVPPALEGRGLANRMAELVIADVRRRGMRLSATCPFFAAYLKKHPEHADIVNV